METTWHETTEPMRKLGPVVMLILIIAAGVVIAISTSVVKIGGTEVGIVNKKIGGGSLPEGRIIATNGENGIQAQILSPGWHFFYWPWQYDITKDAMTKTEEGFVGLIQSADGKILATDTIYATEWDKPEKMLQAEYFLKEGNGFKGPQLTVLQPGTYRINTKLFTITSVPITNITVGTVAVIKSNVGEKSEGESRLVEVGQKGIWNKPLTEGKYRLNTKAYEVTMVSIRQTKVSYTAEQEAGELRDFQPLKPITVRSKDGFTFPVDVRITFLIKPQDAPKVVATIGDDSLILDKLVTPTVRAIFRNNAEKVKALEYVQNRSTQEKQSTLMLKDELEKYGVTILAVRIGDVGDEQSLGNLLKTQTDREIALQQQATFEEQQRAAEKQKALSKTQQEAEEEKRLATANYSVKIAEQDKQKKIIAAQAEAEQVTLVAKAKAEAYKIISSVIGPDNASLLEIMKLVSEKRLRITPEVMVNGSNSQMTDALMGTILNGMIGKEAIKK